MAAVEHRVDRDAGGNAEHALHKVAGNGRRRGQTLAEMALAWILKDDLVTSVIIGASSVGQLADNLKAIDNTAFSAEELKNIYQIVK